MATIKIRLDYLPEDIRVLRQMAPRTDGADALPLRITRWGFGPRADAGEVVEPDLSALGFVVAQLPPEISVVRELRVLATVASGQYPDLHMKPAGSIVTAPDAAAAWAIAAGIAEAA